MSRRGASKPRVGSHSPTGEREVSQLGKAQQRVATVMRASGSPPGELEHILEDAGLPVVPAPRAAGAVSPGVNSGDERYNQRRTSLLAAALSGSRGPMGQLPLAPAGPAASQTGTVSHPLGVTESPSDDETPEVLALQLQIAQLRLREARARAKLLSTGPPLPSAAAPGPPLAVPSSLTGRYASFTDVALPLTGRRPTPPRGAATASAVAAAPPPSAVSPPSPPGRAATPPPAATPAAAAASGWLGVGSPAASDAGTTASQTEAIIQALAVRSEQDRARNSCVPLVLTPQQCNAPIDELNASVYALVGRQSSNYRHYLFGCKLAGTVPMRLAILFAHDARTFETMRQRILGFDEALQRGADSEELWQLIMTQVQSANRFSSLSTSDLRAMFLLRNDSGDVRGYLNALDVIKRTVARLESEYGLEGLRTEKLLGPFIEAQPQQFRSSFYDRIRDVLNLPRESSRGPEPVRKMLELLSELATFKRVLFENATPERPADPLFVSWFRMTDLLTIMQTPTGTRAHEPKVDVPPRASRGERGVAVAAALPAVPAARYPPCGNCGRTNHTTSACHAPRQRSDAGAGGPPRGGPRYDARGPPPRPGQRAPSAAAATRGSGDARHNRFSGDARAPRPQGGVVCWVCGQPGHMRADCTQQSGAGPPRGPPPGSGGSRGLPHAKMALAPARAHSVCVLGASGRGFEA